MEIDPNGAAQTGSEPADAPDGEAMGLMIREARKAKGLTLEDTARAAGIGRSTLSKIENNQTRPSFDIIRRIMQTLELETPQLFLQSAKTDISGRRDYTRAGQGEIKKTPTYTHELLCNELTSKSMVPYISTVTAREVSEYDDWVRHNGEEFMFVLSGELTLVTEHYRPLHLGPGDSVYYDARMGHGLISTSEEDAKVLWVSLGL
ncbi:XRE family transcriptional regulator [uncultured Aliiroseovarius sp.]|uniref:helix-turn-helix domain-containing protein n=1 Tax=uncultured Aliiroseovarius sp. TaxID=1658783 RepID=UPI002607E6C2|nr:XRE family transcriptional regulator [uncultured Aliiroseovarius sp.]